MTRLALPLALGELSFVLITATDFLMIGWLGQRELAAAALGLNWVWLIHSLDLGTLGALAPIAAQALGARSLRLVRRTIRQGFWVALTMAPITLFALWHTQTVLVWLGQDPDLAALSSPYIRTLSLGIPASLGTVVLWNLFSTHGRAGVPMAVANCGILLNALLDYLLIFGLADWPGLGLIGAGVASAAVHWFIFLALLIMTLRDRRFRRYALFGRFWRSDWPRYREILRVGLPLGLSLVVEMGFFSATTFLVGHYDPAALAAHAVALQIAGVVYMLAVGLGFAASIRVGHAVGAGQPDQVRLRGWVAVQLAIATMLPICLVLFLFGPEIMSMFTDPDGLPDAAFVTTGTLLLQIAAAFLVFDAARAALHGGLAGLKDTRVPMLYQILGFWVVGLGTAWGSAAFWDGGASGVWWGITVGTSTGALLLLWRWSQRCPAGGLRPATETAG